jgi:hypothetical protein
MLNRSQSTTGNDIQTQRDRAGKGNVINLLELSPARGRVVGEDEDV